MGLGLDFILFIAEIRKSYSFSSEWKKYNFQGRVKPGNRAKGQLGTCVHLCMNT